MISFLLNIIVFQIYLTPNFQLLSFGESENSTLPLFIIPLAIRYLSQFDLLFSFAILCILIISECFLGSSSFPVNLAPLAVSIYILFIPVFVSILYARYLFSTNYIAQSLLNSKSIRNILLFFLSLPFFYQFLLILSPDIALSIYHAGRTTGWRLTYFFIEPSQSAPWVIFFLCLILFYRHISKISSTTLLSNSDLYLFFSLLAIICLTTGSFNLYVTIAVFIFSWLTLYSLIKPAKIPSKLLKSIYIIIFKFKVEKPVLLFISVTVSALFLLLFFFGKYALDLYLRLLIVLDSDSLIYGLRQISGFRLDYITTSVNYGISTFIKAPGAWPITFSRDVVENAYNLFNGSDYNTLQLGKDAFLVKPSGWLYFVLYDYGFLITALFIVYIVLLFFSSRQLRKNSYLFSMFAAAQISLLIVPTLPANPMQFSPLLISIVANYILSALPPQAKS